MNKYIAVYYPEHERAFSNGCVYEHIIVAEKMLNRNLTKDEVVHHKDFNKQNNSKDNLMVFATNKDHIYFHNGGEAILTDKGNYITIKKKKFKGHNMCPYCGKNFKKTSSVMCKECRLRRNKLPTKEILQDLIFRCSFVEIGKKYNVSDNTVRKWCKKYNLKEKT